MFCTKCGADKGNLSYCPNCGAGVKKDVLYAQSETKFPVFAVIFSVVILIIMGIDVFQTVKYYTRLDASVAEMFLVYYAEILAVGLVVGLMVQLILKKRKGLFALFLCYSLFLLLGSLGKIAGNDGAIEEAFDHSYFEDYYSDYSVLSSLNTYIQGFVALLCDSFVLLWIGILTFSRQRSKKFLRDAPFLVAGVYFIERLLIFLGNHGLIWFATLNHPGSYDSSSYLPFWKIVDILVWVGFYFFLTRFFAKFFVSPPVYYSAEETEYMPSSEYNSSSDFTYNSTASSETEAVAEEESADESITESFGEAEKSPLKSEMENEAEKAEPTVQESARSSQLSDKEIIEALKQYKELLDLGVITQEEFDRKKLRLLG